MFGSRGAGFTPQWQYGYVHESSLTGCGFETDRLRVGEWHSVANQQSLDLVRAVAGILTEESTRALPAQWHGEYSLDRCRAWIDERDGESPTLLVLDSQSSDPLGLVILFETAVSEGSLIDLRIGYLFDEAVWGNGLASEVVGGLVGWARSQPRIQTLTGGVTRSNPASARVLAKNGFELIGGLDDAELIYQLSVSERDTRG
ncbi:MAG: GNAT family N-acetyltransferase [Acidobacteria bacterium]|nr:GNAT family N-acetyltransferase [Acidobacteriota bacterium]